MKRLFNILILTLTVLTFILPSISCKSCKENPPWTYKNVIWYSYNPEIEIKALEDKDPTGYIMFNGEKIDVDLLWGETYSFAIIYADCEVISEEDVLLSGAVTDFNIESTILKVEKDNVFNYQYKTITLYRRAIEE